MMLREKNEGEDGQIHMETMSTLVMVTLPTWSHYTTHHLHLFKNTLHSLFLTPTPISISLSLSPPFFPYSASTATRSLCDCVNYGHLTILSSIKPSSSSFNSTQTTKSSPMQMFQNNTRNDDNSKSSTLGEGCSKTITTECRICQEEDEEHELESPCACNGTLKFAHRKCIQKWCNKKGDTTCEICSQVYSPNYALPPARSNPDVMTIDIRHAWGPQIDLRDAHFLAFASADNQFLEPDYEEYGVGNNSSIAYLRFIALILMLILLVRQALLVTRDLGMLAESSKFFNFQVSVLQLMGLLLPCYVVGRSWLMILRQRRQV